MIKTVVFDLYNVLYPYTDEAEFVVADLRARGKKIAAISSMAPDKINEIAMKYDIRMVLSAQDTPYSKRDPELYKSFLDKFGLKAEECLFVDDEAEKIAAAEKAGMKTWLLSDGRALKELLDNNF
ncbi:MAG: HAD-IA family hydrolase [Candidatus Falkowbacteria bacterium]